MKSKLYIKAGRFHVQENGAHSREGGAVLSPVFRSRVPPSLFKRGSTGENDIHNGIGFAESEMNLTRIALRWFAYLFLVFGFLSKAIAVQISWTASTNFYVD